MKTKTINLSCLLALFCLAVACSPKSDEPQSQPEAAFEQVWRDFDQNYAGFSNGGRNWDSLRTVYRQQVTASTSASALFSILGTMTLSLRDGHADIYDTQTGQSASFYNVYIRQKPANFIGRTLIQSNYLTESNQINPKILAGRIGSDIGFIRVTDFADNATVYAVIDEVMQKYGSLAGFIVDVRSNGGGDEANAQTIASRFADQARTYRYAKLRNGAGRGDFSDFLPLQFSPAGAVRFLKPVLLLTNRRTFSAAEDFTLMMRALPNVRQLGDTTFGGVFTRPQATKLSYGWTYRVPSAINCDARKRPITGGIAPDAVVQISRADSLAGKDTILEAAIRLLRP
jgi:Peptidase family S41/Tricorn protease C1 domain